MLASIWLETKGIPALALCTTAFTPSLKALAKMNGRPDKAWAMIPHPFGSLDEAGVRQRAEFLVSEFYKYALVDPG